MPAFTPDQYSAFWSAVGAVATVAAAIAAIITLSMLRGDSRERTRPFVGAHLRSIILGMGSEFVVRNYGPTPATDVKVSFAPPLPKLTGAEAAGKVTPFLERRYSRVIPTLAPGAELSNVYTAGPIETNDEPVPLTFSVTIDYKDHRRKKAYSDRYDLSIDTLMDGTTSNPSGTDEQKLRKRSTQALEAIAKLLGR